MSIFIKVLECKFEDLELLFSLIEFVIVDDFCEMQVLFLYIYKYIICSNSIDFWRVVVLWCFDIYVGRMVFQWMKWYFIYNIVNLIFVMDVMCYWFNKIIGLKFLDKFVIDLINIKIWRVNLMGFYDDFFQFCIDYMRMEVLQFLVMFVKYYSGMFEFFRKDFIKFGWIYICLDDVINKYVVYVVIGYFIVYYEIFVKIVIQIYLFLLKINQNEGWFFVMQVLELMVFVMFKYCVVSLGD